MTLKKNHGSNTFSLFDLLPERQIPRSGRQTGQDSLRFSASEKKINCNLHSVPIARSYPILTGQTATHYSSRRTQAERHPDS